MTDLQIHLTTFNCGRSFIHLDYFASSLHSSLNAQLPPDLLVLALQEIAPLGYSFLGGTWLAPYFKKIIEAVEKATAGSVEHVVTRNVGMTGIIVFARKEIRERIKWMEEAGTGVGLWEMGNKGAVGIRLGLEREEEEEDENVVTFVAAHLAPMEDAVQRRNEDWRNICETLVFEQVDGKALGNGSGESEPLLSSPSEPTSEGRSGEPHTLFSPPSHIFFAGDLNYRTANSPPDPKEFSTWPQPMASDNDPTHYTHLLKNDQLTRELHSKKTLHYLSEAPIAFPPTYKYSSRAQALAEETAKAHLPSTKSNELMRLDDIQEQVWLWAKHRMPSWCDRVLFLTSAPPTKVHKYAALPVQPTSDHRPVVLSCSISDKAVKAVIQPPFAIAKDWKATRSSARTLEILVGVGAYLGFTGQGQALSAGTVVGIIAGHLVLSYLVAGGS